MKDATPQSIALESAKVAFLEAVAQKYDLPDIGKAVRCLVSHAQTHPEDHDAMFSEVRCEDC